MEGEWTGRALVSPDLELVPEPWLAYRGAFELPIAGVAVATRHHFVDADARRLLVVQFERTTTRYTFDLPDPIELGGALWGRWAFELHLAEETGPEMTATIAFLGVALPDGHAVARFARTTDAERQHEIIVFFHDCEGPLDGVLERALGAFELRQPAA
jgi:hypothetical protein